MLNASFRLWDLENAAIQNIPNWSIFVKGKMNTAIVFVCMLHWKSFEIYSVNVSSKKKVMDTDTD